MKRLSVLARLTDGIGLGVQTGHELAPFEEMSAQKRHLQLLLAFLLAGLSSGSPKGQASQLGRLVHDTVIKILINFQTL